MLRVITNDIDHNQELTDENKTPVFFKNQNTCSDFLSECISPIQAVKIILIWLKGYELEEKKEALLSLCEEACNKANKNKRFDQIIYIIKALTTIARTHDFISASEQYIYEAED